MWFLNLTQIRTTDSWLGSLRGRRLGGGESNAKSHFIILIYCWGLQTKLSEVLTPPTFGFTVSQREDQVLVFQPGPEFCRSRCVLFCLLLEYCSQILLPWLRTRTETVVGYAHSPRKRETRNRQNRTKLEQFAGAGLNDLKSDFGLSDSAIWVPERLAPGAGQSHRNNAP